MFVNELKSKLKENAETAYGIFIGFPSTQLVEIAAYNGFDVVVIDDEHGTFTSQDIENMTIAAERAGVTPLVRVPSSDRINILKALDRGAHGVHVPQVNTKDEAKRVVEAVKYPPLGSRGAAFSMRAAKYGTVPIDQYLTAANEQTLVCIHIETKEALDNLEEIVQVDGIDMIYIGPTDLSVSIGYKGDIHHPDVLDAIDSIKKTANKYGVKVGIHTKDSRGAKKRRDWGADYVGLTITSLINQSFSTYINEVKHS